MAHESEISPFSYSLCYCPRWGCGVSISPPHPALMVPEARWTEGFGELQHSGSPQIPPFLWDNQNPTRKRVGEYWRKDALVCKSQAAEIWGSFSRIQLLELLKDSHLPAISLVTLAAGPAMAQRRIHTPQYLLEEIRPVSKPEVTCPL